MSKNLENVFTKVDAKAKKLNTSKHKRNKKYTIALQKFKKLDVQSNPIEQELEEVLNVQTIEPIYLRLANLVKDGIMYNKILFKQSVLRIRRNDCKLSEVNLMYNKLKNLFDERTKEETETEMKRTFEKFKICMLVCCIDKWYRIKDNAVNDAQIRIVATVLFNCNKTFKEYASALWRSENPELFLSQKESTKLSDELKIIFDSETQEFVVKHPNMSEEYWKAHENNLFLKKKMIPLKFFRHRVTINNKTTSVKNHFNYLIRDITKEKFLKLFVKEEKFNDFLDIFEKFGIYKYSDYSDLDDLVLFTVTIIVYILNQIKKEKYIDLYEYLKTKIDLIKEVNAYKKDYLYAYKLLRGLRENNGIKDTAYHTLYSVLGSEILDVLKKKQGFLEGELLTILKKNVENNSGRRLDDKELLKVTCRAIVDEGFDHIINTRHCINDLYLSIVNYKVHAPYKTLVIESIVDKSLNVFGVEYELDHLLYFNMKKHTRVRIENNSIIRLSVDQVIGTVRKDGLSLFTAIYRTKDKNLNNVKYSLPEGKVLKTLMNEWSKLAEKRNYYREKIKTTKSKEKAQELKREMRKVISKRIDIIGDEKNHELMTLDEADEYFSGVEIVRKDEMNYVIGTSAFSKPNTRNNRKYLTILLKNREEYKEVTLTNMNKIINFYEEDGDAFQKNIDLTKRALIEDLDDWNNFNDELDKEPTRVLISERKKSSNEDLEKEGEGFDKFPTKKKKKAQEGKKESKEKGSKILSEKSSEKNKKFSNESVEKSGSVRRNSLSVLDDENKSDSPLHTKVFNGDSENKLDVITETKTVVNSSKKEISLEEKPSKEEINHSESGKSLIEGKKEEKKPIMFNSGAEMTPDISKKIIGKLRKSNEDMIDKLVKLENELKEKESLLSLTKTLEQKNASLERELDLLNESKIRSEEENSDKLKLLTTKVELLQNKIEKLIKENKDLSTGKIEKVTHRFIPKPRRDFYCYFTTAINFMKIYSEQWCDDSMKSLIDEYSNDHEKFMYKKEYQSLIKKDKGVIIDNNPFLVIKLFRDFYNINNRRYEIVELLNPVVMREDVWEGNIFIKTEGNHCTLIHYTNGKLLELNDNVVTEISVEKFFEYQINVTVKKREKPPVKERVVTNVNKEKLLVKDTMSKGKSTEVKEELIIENENKNQEEKETANQTELSSKTMSEIKTNPSNNSKLLEEDVQYRRQAKMTIRKSLNMCFQKSYIGNFKFNRQFKEKQKVARTIPKYYDNDCVFHSFFMIYNNELLELYNQKKTYKAMFDHMKSNILNIMEYGEKEYDKYDFLYVKYVVEEYLKTKLIEIPSELSTVRVKDHKNMPDRIQVTRRSKIKHSNTTFRIGNSIYRRCISTIYNEEQGHVAIYDHKTSQVIDNEITNHKKENVQSETTYLTIYEKLREARWYDTISEVFTRADNLNYMPESVFATSNEHYILRSKEEKTFTNSEVRYLKLLNVKELLVLNFTISILYYILAYTHLIFSFFSINILIFIEYISITGLLTFLLLCNIYWITTIYRNWIYEYKESETKTHMTSIIRFLKRIFYESSLYETYKKLEKLEKYSSNLGSLSPIKIKTHKFTKKRLKVNKTLHGKYSPLVIKELKSYFKDAIYKETETNCEYSIFNYYIKRKTKCSIRHHRHRIEDAMDMSEMFLKEHDSIECDVNVYYHDVLSYTLESVIKNEVRYGKSKFFIILPFHQCIVNHDRCSMPNFGGVIEISGKNILFRGNNNETYTYLTNNYWAWLSAKCIMGEKTVLYNLKSKAILYDHVIMEFDSGISNYNVREVKDETAFYYSQVAFPCHLESNALIKKYMLHIAPKNMHIFALATISSKLKVKSLSTQALINYLKKMWKEKYFNEAEEWYEKIDKMGYVNALVEVTKIHEKLDKKDYGVNLGYESIKNLIVNLFENDDKELTFLRKFIIRDLQDYVNFKEQDLDLNVHFSKQQITELKEIEVNGFKKLSSEKYYENVFNNRYKRLVLRYNDIIKEPLAHYNPEFHNLFNVSMEFSSREVILTAAERELEFKSPYAIISQNYVALVNENLKESELVNKAKLLQLIIVGNVTTTSKEVSPDAEYYVEYSNGVYTLRVIKNNINFNNMLKQKVLVAYNPGIIEYIEKNYFRSAENENCLLKAIYGSEYTRKLVKDQEKIAIIINCCVEEGVALLDGEELYAPDEIKYIMLVENNHVHMLKTYDKSIENHTYMCNIKHYTKILNGPVYNDKLKIPKEVTKYLRILRKSILKSYNNFKNRKYKNLSLNEWYNYEKTMAEEELENLKENIKYFEQKILSNQCFVAFKGRIITNNEAEEYVITEKGIEPYKQSIEKDRMFVVSSAVLNFLRSIEIMKNYKDVTEEDVKLNYVSGYPGCGKTTALINMDAPMTIMCSPNKKNAQQIQNAVKCLSKTLDSLTINNYKGVYERLCVDEIDKCHIGQVYYVALKYKCKEIYMCGDKNQISTYSRHPMIKFRYNVYNAHNENAVIKNTHRCPQKHIRILRKTYYPGITSSNKKEGTVRVVFLNTQHIDENHQVYLTFTQWEKEYLQRKKKNCYTFGEFQGESANDVCIVRFSTRNDNPLYEDDQQIAVALSRSKEHLTYMTASNDKLTKILLSEGNDLDINEKKTSNTKEESQEDVSKFKPIPMDIVIDDKSLTVTRENDKTLDKIEYNSGLFIDTNYTLYELYETYLEDTTEESFVDVSKETISAIMYEIHDNYRYVENIIRTWKEIHIPDELYVHPSKFLQDRYSIKEKENYTTLKLFNNVELQENIHALSIENVEKRNLASKPIAKFFSEKVKRKIDVIINSIFDKEKLNTYKKFCPTSNISELKKWYAKRTKLQRDRIEADVNEVINKYYAHLKREEKPDLENKDIMMKPKSQVVVASTGNITAYFAAHLSVLNYYLENCLKGKYIYYNGLNKEKLKYKLNRVDEEGIYRAIDMSKFDKSQLEVCMYIFSQLLRKIGVNEHVIKTYLKANKRTSVSIVELGAKFIIDYTKKSGEFTTYASNSIIVLIIVLFCENIPEKDLLWILFGGDDNVIKTRPNYKYKNNFEIYSDVFNMECKYENYTKYFASRFLVKSANGIELCADPLKIIKSLTKYLTCKEHIELYHISYKDNTKTLKNNVNSVAKMTYEKYKTCYRKLTIEMCYVMVWFLISIQDKSKFLDLYNKNKNYEKKLDINIKQKLIAELKAREIISVDTDYE